MTKHSSTRSPSYQAVDHRFRAGPTVSRRGRVRAGWIAFALAGGGIAGTGALAAAGPLPLAFADQYGPAAQCTMSVSPTSVAAGQMFTVTVNVGPGSLPSPTTAPVMLSGSSVPLGTVTVPTTGTASATFTAPLSIGPGLHAITVNACSATLATSVVVPPSSSPGSSAPGAAVIVSPTATTVAPAVFVPAAGAAVATPGSSSVLAFTGADLAATVAVGAVAVGGGATLILLSRRRRRSA